MGKTVSEPFGELLENFDEIVSGLILLYVSSSHRFGMDRETCLPYLLSLSEP